MQKEQTIGKQVIGWCIFVIGVSIIIFGLMMDTTVDAGLHRVHNIGLMNTQSNSIMLGGIVLIGGLLFALLSKKTNVEPVKESSSSLPEAVEIVDGNRTLIERGDMNAAGWHYNLYADGSVKIMNRNIDYDYDYEYDSMNEAKKQFTWWVKNEKV